MRIAALARPRLNGFVRGPENAAASYRAVIARGEEAALAGADLLVFPESAFPMYWDKSPRLREDLERLAETCRCPILFNDVTSEKDGRASNAAGLLTPGGRGIVIDAFGRSVDTVFLAAVPIALAGFAITLLLRELPLRTTQDALPTSSAPGVDLLDGRPDRDVVAAQDRT